VDEIKAIYLAHFLYRFLTKILSSSSVHLPASHGLVAIDPNKKAKMTI